MTKREIIKEAREFVKWWIVYKDESDRAYLLQLLKDGDLDEFFAQFSIVELDYKENKNAIDYIDGLEDEWSSICD